ncbi:prepilin peptidase [Yersinia aleksiciae]|uniref:Prepilin leader peptidase/N-methyltransferase n=1 Tax=Yersinia aleksiciae TaxID=263819 RepID=A0ABM5UAT4_YERAE|nr:A24 family peptidase [Yersinia aleksiciae]AKP32931.1 prepilin peptidase [Yersinia aleksiciae]MDA5498956.1 A24 family peptidase [Yersinia aleksiciae]NIK99573.1 prepilin peptidase [Yersinia aleksiciae]WQC71426.1 A24 family peptidase [Yersinia aleksiciae]CFQ52898.1 prepilin peptidase [Yersinia aleksiciae]
MVDVSKLGYAFFFIFIGLCVGSFLNVIIYRLPIMLTGFVSKKSVKYKESEVFKNKINLCFPRSFCPSCYCPLGIRHNIPIFSWLFLRGITHCCKQSISPRYLVVELLTAILTLAIIYCMRDNYIMIASLFLVWSLVVLSFIDLDCYLLPDCITLPLLWGGLLLNINNSFSPLPFAVIGAVGGYLFLWVPYWLLKIFRGVEGMGYGDFKLMSALGAWFGLSAIPALVLLSSCFGIIAYIAIYNVSKSKVKYIAFGPYIALSGVVYLFLVE